MIKFAIPLGIGAVVLGAAAFAATAAPGDRHDDRDRERPFAHACADMVPREAGRMAFLESKLSLTGQQQALFNGWKQVKLREAGTMSAKCASRDEARAETGSPLEHMAREEEHLKARIVAIEAERPALQALYNSLNETQRAEFAEAGRHGHGMGRHMGGFRHHGAPMRGGEPMDAPPPPDDE